MPTGISNGNSHHMQRLRIELREQIDEAQHKAKLEALHAEDKAAYRELIALDLEGGEAWYDDDNNVPAFGSTRERIKIVRARIEYLKSQRGKDG